MTENKALARKISALTAKDQYMGRALQLGPSGAPESLTHLLRAVDDTMLQRDAVFAVGKRSVTLRISGKRVQMLVAASADFGIPADQLLRPLGADSHQEIAALETILRSLVAEKGILTVERRPVCDDAGGAGSGVGVQTLAAGWHVDLEAAQAGPMQRFLAVCGPLSDATIVTSKGKITSVAGAEADIDVLQNILTRKLDAFHDAHRGFLAGEETRSLRVLDKLAPEGRLLILAAIDESACVALLPGREIAQIAAAWSGALS